MIERWQTHLLHALAAMNTKSGQDAGFYTKSDVQHILGALVISDALEAEWH